MGVHGWRNAVKSHEGSLVLFTRYIKDFAISSVLYVLETQEYCDVINVLYSITEHEHKITLIWSLQNLREFTIKVPLIVSYFTAYYN